MANRTYKFRGTKQPVSFGVEKLDGYIIEATEETIEGEELEIEDEDSNVVARFSGFGIRYKRTASLIPLKGAEAPVPGDSFKIGDTFEFIVKSVKKSSAKKDVEKWSIEGTYYPEVPMEPVDPRIAIFFIVFVIPFASLKAQTSYEKCCAPPLFDL